MTDIIRPIALRPRGRTEAQPRPFTIYAVACAESGTAALTALCGVDGVIDVVGIARLPAGLDRAAAWIREAVPGLRPDSMTRVIIDGDGLGTALFDHLAVRRLSFTLYGAKGRDRQRLVDSLLVAEQEHRIRIRPSNHADAMRRALLNRRLVVGDDGQLGQELVVALALATTVRRPAPARIW